MHSICFFAGRELCALDVTSNISPPPQVIGSHKNDCAFTLTCMSYFYVSAQYCDPEAHALSCDANWMQSMGKFATNNGVQQIYISKNLEPRQPCREWWTFPSTDGLQRWNSCGHR